MNGEEIEKEVESTGRNKKILIFFVVLLVVVIVILVVGLFFGTAIFGKRSVSEEERAIASYPETPREVLLAYIGAMESGDSDSVLLFLSQEEVDKINSIAGLSGRTFEEQLSEKIASELDIWSKVLQEEIREEVSDSEAKIFIKNRPDSESFSGSYAFVRVGEQWKIGSPEFVFGAP